jgi:hypothetical protein
LTVTLARIAVAQNFAYEIEERSRLVGVKPLHAGNGLASGEREVRIWLGFGMIEPETFTRIRTDGESVQGSKTFWWTHATGAEEAAAERDPNLISNGELYANLRKTAGCGPRRRRGEHEMCAARLAAGQSWQAMLQSLDSLGIGDLANGNSIGLDGWRLVVEVREGASYRTYSYFMPAATSPASQERHAAAIVELVGRIGYRE